jgi:hypothetical protein
MRRTIQIAIAVMALATPMIGNPAWADAPSAEGFGQHVSECAQQMGFSGDHNPGMHRGAAGWNGMSCAD